MLMWLCLCACTLVYEWSAYRNWARDVRAPGTPCSQTFDERISNVPSCEVANEACVRCTDDIVAVFLQISSSEDIGTRLPIRGMSWLHQPHASDVCVVSMLHGILVLRLHVPTPLT
jgi:hypothetical protein